MRKLSMNSAPTRDIALEYEYTTPYHIDFDAVTAKPEAKPDTKPDAKPEARPFSLKRPRQFELLTVEVPDDAKRAASDPSYAIMYAVRTEYSDATTRVALKRFKRDKTAANVAYKLAVAEGRIAPLPSKLRV
jgi:hypothetical protein